MFTIAPAALADETEPTVPVPTDTPPTPETPAPTDPAPTEPAPTDTPAPADTPTTPAPSPSSDTAPKAKAKAGVEAAAEEIEADFGFQKIRVGVQVADGSWVPEGTTTVGTQIRITETGPGVIDGEYTTTCTTQASTVQPGSTASYCVFDEPEIELSRQARAQAAAVDPDPDPIPGQQWIAAPGDTVTFEQITVNENLIIDSSTPVVGPCGAIIPQIPFCPTPQRVLFNDTGFPPEASDDSATTDEGEAVTIDVLDNDDTVHGAPLTGLEVTSGPDHGSTTVTGSGDNRRVRYTPEDGFHGVDHFRYRISTPNGTASADVTITVREVEDAAVLPDTGGADRSLLIYGIVLMAGGGVLIAEGPRRPRRELSAID